MTFDDGLTEDEIFDDTDPELDVSEPEAEDTEDLHEDAEKKYQSRDASDEKVRQIAREEASALTDADRAQRMVDDFVRDATETEKQLVELYLDPSRGSKVVKESIDKLRAKATALDETASKQADNEGRAEARSAFRGTLATPPYPAGAADDERQKDFDRVATNAPDAEEAQRRMIQRKFDESGWAPTKVTESDLR